MKSVITWEMSGEGIVSLILDDPDQPVNTVSVAYIQALSEAVDRLEAESDSVKGVIVRSKKKSFLAGGDLNRLLDAGPETLDDFVADIDARKDLTKRLESLPIPVVAVINGPALGGGLELALCCHHTIAVDDGRVLVGLPESRLGLMPGAGGIVRTIQRLGIDRALDSLILPGHKYSLADAIAIGLIDEAAESTEDAIRSAQAWIAANPSGQVRTEVTNRGFARALPAPRAVPVNRAVIRAANCALTATTVEALHVESVEFGRVVVSGATKNALRVQFFATNALRKRVKSISSVQIDPAEVPEADRPAVWHAPDYVGDGQKFAEVSWDGSECASAYAAGLLKSGVVPILLGSVHQPFSYRIKQALEHAIAEKVQSGQSRMAIDRALYWAGLDSGTEALPDQHMESVSEDDVELACDLLDRMAAEGRAAVEANVLAFAEDVDAASVRVAGFPGWTGGIDSWLADGRKLALSLHAASQEEKR